MADIRDKYIRIIYIPQRGNYLNLFLNIEGLLKEEVEKILKINNYDYDVLLQFIRDIGMGMVDDLDFCYSNPPKYTDRIVGKPYHEHFNCPEDSEMTREELHEKRQKLHEKEKEEDEIAIEEADTLADQMNKNNTNCRTVVVQLW